MNRNGAFRTLCVVAAVGFALPITAFGAQRVVLVEEFTNVG